MDPALPAHHSVRRRAFRAWDPRRATGRLLAAALTGVLAAALVPQRFGAVLRLVVGWDAASLVLLGLAWRLIFHASPAETSRRAAAQDVGRTAVWGIVLLSSTFSIFAANGAIRSAKTMAPLATRPLVLLCLLAVTTAWVCCHTAYTLRYAHLYYRDDGDLGGLTFPGTEQPCDLDFAYYAFTIGMCFQVSDVVVTQHKMRRATLGHALLSFAYNTAVLAVALNLLFGQL